MNHPKTNVLMDYVCYHGEKRSAFHQGLGPETITIDIDNEYFNGKTLKYVAYNFSGNPVIAESGATVSVYKGSVLVDTFEVPVSGSGNAWYVIDIDADGVHEVNELIQYRY